MVRQILSLVFAILVLVVSGPIVAHSWPPAPEVTVATLPGAPDSGDTVWVTDATGPTADPGSWDCEAVGDPPTKLLCSWDGANWIGIQRQLGGTSGTAPPQMIGGADRVSYDGEGGDWPEGLPTEVDGALDKLAVRSGLPTGGTTDDLIENTAPGVGAWVDPGTVTVGTASALAANPAACTGTNFVQDMDADGTLNCANPLLTRSIEDLVDVSTLLGTTAVIRPSLNEDGVTDNAVCFDVNDNLKDCGVAPTGGGNIEAMATAGSGGTAAVSDGDTTLSMQDIATQAELEAQSAWPEWFQGELALLSDTGYTATAVDVSGDSYIGMMNVFSEESDHLGHWRYRSQGDDGSSDWRADSLACWYPPHTHYVYVADHCSGIGSSTFSASEGRPCSIAGDCYGGSETCDAEDWDMTQSPDKITITGHDFGSAGTAYAGLLGLKRGHNGAPVHGGTGTIPLCTPAIIDAAFYWAYVVDANTIILYLDDGDLIQELGDNGPPPTNGQDVPLECTNMYGWQGLTIHPRNADGSNATHEFQVIVRQDVQVTDSTGQDLQCMGGTNHGTACDTLWEQGDQCTGSPAGVCMEVTDPWLIGVGFSVDHPEGVESNDLVASSTAYKYVYKHSGWDTFMVVGLADMVPGECIQPTAYVGGATDLDTIGPGGATISIYEPKRSAPERTRCAPVTNGSVGASCLNYSIITNRDAPGAIEGELAAFVEGMNFCVINETGNTFAVDPNGTERFLAPATDTDGDKLTSAVAGDAFCAQVFSGGEARVIFNSGGWNDGGP